MTIKLDDHLCFKLYVASRMIMRGYAERLMPFKLTYPKYLLLLALSEDNGQTVGVLAERLSLDFGTLSPLLKSLAESGFVERHRHPDDERTVVSHITASGRAALKKASAVAYDLFCETQMEYDAFVALRTEMDDYIGRCKNILETSKLNRPLKAGKTRGQHI